MKFHPFMSKKTTNKFTSYNCNLLQYCQFIFFLSYHHFHNLQKKMLLIHDFDCIIFLAEIHLSCKISFYARSFLTFNFPSLTIYARINIYAIMLYKRGLLLLLSMIGLRFLNKIQGVERICMMLPLPSN